METLRNNGEPTRTRQQLIQAIYEAYPRHVAPITAFYAIDDALRRIEARGTVDSGAWLLERVRLYARARANCPKRFTPHPTTWFDDGRYDEDEAEWYHNSGKRPPPSQDELARLKEHTRLEDEWYDIPFLERRQIADSLNVVCVGDVACNTALLRKALNLWQSLKKGMK